MLKEIAATASNDLTSRSRSRWPVVALLLTTAVIFSPVLRMPLLLWDDVFMIVNNDDLRPESWPAIVRYWSPSNPHIGLYIPVTYSVYYLLSFLGHLFTGSLSPAFFHAANILAHLISGWLVWRLLNRLGIRGGPSLLGAGLFLLHPLQVEAVAWAASLNTTLAGAGSLGALLLYVASVQAAARRQRWLFIASCVALVLALLAKPSVCGVPLAAMAIDRLLLVSPWAEVLRRVGVWLALTLPIVVAGKIAQPAMTISSPLAWRPIVVVDTVGFHIAKLIVPIRLTVDYGRKPEFVVTWPTSTIVFAGIAGASLAAILWQRNARPWLAAGGVIFIAGIAPVLGLVDFDFQQYSSVADRYVYPAMLGVALVAAYAMRSVSESMMRIVLGLVLTTCAFLTSMQLRYWHSETLLFERTMTFNRESFAAHAMLAKVEADDAERSGDDAARRRIRASARVHYEHASALRPQDQAVRLAFAQLLERAGDFAAATEQYKVASERGLWSTARLHVRWGLALSNAGRHAEAIAHLHRAVTLEADSADAQAALGIALCRANRAADAMPMFARALAIEPNNRLATEGLATPPMIVAP